MLEVSGLGFKFVDFLYKSSDMRDTEIKIISSENTFCNLSYETFRVVLLTMV